MTTHKAPAPRQEYLCMLEEGWRELDHNGPLTRLEYLADYIFEFVTYDGTMSELFATKALEVCAAINEGKTFEYIQDAENYQWFLLMCNTTFFSEKLDWGTSIRGAFWQHENTNFQSSGLWLNGQQMTELEFTHDQWLEFIAAMREFARKNDDDTQSI